MTYTWDARNRLTGLSGPNLTASFAYDGLGRRASKTLNGVVTQFLYDGLDMVKESSGGSDVTYLRALGIDEALGRTDATGSLFYLSDALGSTVALTTAGGTPATTYTYAPFGQTAVGGTPSPNPYRFTGREDDGTGLYYYRARYYDPGRGRFVSEDPMGFDGGVNAYVYTLDSPLNWVDPLGLDVQICLRPMSGPPPFSDYPHTFLYSTTTKTGYGLGPKPGWEVLTPWMKVPGQIENDYPYDSSGRIKPQNQCTTESRDKCVEDCANRKARDATRRPPGYRLGTYQCDTWANDLLRQCRQECGK